MWVWRGKGVSAADAGSWFDVTNRKSAGREALADLELVGSSRGKYSSYACTKLRLMWYSLRCIFGCHCHSERWL